MDGPLVCCAQAEGFASCRCSVGGLVGPVNTWVLISPHMNGSKGSPARNFYDTSPEATRNRDTPQEALFRSSLPPLNNRSSNR
ncbi:hypothetical protein PAHAL_2G256600 [Panicum hallii]|uniref:Uncharacterized protein n=1 Tax=Panicum hallii TaxID=206008 RepID=A0A2T8KQG8_9POAL|nr:hypothetical protein PAHAL_2G256600 [Panicum hallii]